MYSLLYTTTTEIERARTLLEKAVFLIERTDGFYITKLYQLHNLYLEVVWHKHFNVVVKVCSFTDTEHLEPYLDTISLKSLFV